MNALPQNLIDLRDPAFVNDPYSVYAQLRNEAPVYLSVRDDGVATWLLTRYADVEFILKDLRFKKDERPILKAGASKTALMSTSMLMTDPPNHMRLRNLVSQAFTPAVSRSLAPRVEAIVHHLLTTIKTRGRLEFMQDFALPLPVIVIAELLGVPGADRERFRGWSVDFAAASDTVGASAETLARGRSAVVALKEYFTWLIAARRSQPEADLISGLIAAHDEGGNLSEVELLENCILLLIAGHETTMNLLGNGFYALLKFPEEMARLRKEPDLLASAVEEMLRYEAPVQRSTFRYAGEPVEVAGHVIALGEHVGAVIGSANRDPEVFPRPDRFDIARQPNRHQSFGRGSHFCLGAPLARLEAYIAFRRLLETFPTLSLTSQLPAWKANSFFRGFERFPVAFA